MERDEETGDFEQRRLDAEGEKCRQRKVEMTSDSKTEAAGDFDRSKEYRLVEKREL